MPQCTGQRRRRTTAASWQDRSSGPQLELPAPPPDAIPKTADSPVTHAGAVPGAVKMPRLAAKDDGESTAADLGELARRKTTEARGPEAASNKSQVNSISSL
ncbi:hypothetical protein B0A49_11634 [Cryomyces minteri]|uniref:Uncharacterized protein n=1 Tax=Cryomyces minteri TaxID=331657 RepID=A0A4U0WTR5_9PEZI|nr:hypothetical protein B0A49_11634 [Cryomyces minteri]